MINTTTKKTLFFKNKILTRFILTYLAVIIGIIAHSQSPQPRTDWKKVTYRDKDIQNQNGLTQTLSGDEWWYGHKTLYSGTVQIGYVAVGYIADLVHPGDEQKMRDAFNEGSDSPNNPYPTSGNFFQIPLQTDAECSDFYDIMGASTPSTNAVEMKTKFRGMVARLDMQGNMIWCRLPCVSGSGLQEVVQDGNYIYVIGSHEGAKSTSLSNKQFISYNPTSAGTATSNVFNKTLYSSIVSTIPKAHMYVAKYDLDGNKIWEHLYGEYDFSLSPTTTWISESVGQDLVLNSNDGQIYAVGRAASPAAPTDPGLLFVAKINPSNGYIVTHSVYAQPTYTNQYAKSINYVEGRSICQVSSGGTMAIGAIGRFSTVGAPNTNEAQKGFVYSITPSLTLNSNWSNNPVTFSATSTSTVHDQISTIWEINYHTYNDEVLVGLVNNCKGCFNSGRNWGEGQIYRLNPASGTLSASGATNPSTMGVVAAYDLRIGVVETSDHGFAAVSARRNAGAFTVPSISSLGTFSLCTILTNTTGPYESTNETYGFWDTDPLISKFDEFGNWEWEWSEDVLPGRARTLPPGGDFKRQECMYKISETEDKGLAISGNASFNHDDNYMVKLYSDCNTYQSYDIAAGITLTTNTTWSSSKKVKGKVVIPSGKILTISGSTTQIQFADSRSTGVPTYIEIQRGGTLNITSGATVTSIDKNVCIGSMWDGISVMGTSTLTQNTGNFVSDQGVLNMSNATISNARTAITTGTHYANGSFNWNSTGGIIWANNSYFINNNRDVQYLTYVPPTGTITSNVGYFNLCHFIVNDQLNDFSNPTGRVSMLDVHGVKFKGCEFANSAGSVYTPTALGYGILSCQADYSVEDFCASCPTPTQSNFSNLAQGIYVANFFQNGTIKVDHAIFTNTFTNAGDPTSGIILSGCDFAEVKNCTFSMADPSAEGIFLNNSKYYSVKNNTLTGASGGQGVGIRVSGSGGGAHKLYRNNFSSHWVGIQAQFENSAFTNNSTNPLDREDGLKMNCNTFSGGSDYDIAVLGWNVTGFKPSVAENQGIATSQNILNADPAKFVRNRYSAGCSAENQWAITSSASTKTLQHVANSDANTRPEYTAGCGSNLLNVVNSQKTFTFSIQCDANAFRPVTNSDCDCKGCCDYADISLDLSNNLYQTSTLTTHYNNTIDGGITQTLLNAINSNTLSDAGMASLLGTYRSYISDTVLITYFRNGAVGHDNTLVTHNDNRPVTGRVWQSILDKGITGPVMDSITAHQSQSFVSKRRALEDELSYAKGQLQFVYAEKINYFLRDTLAGAKDTVINLLSANLGKLPDAQVQLVNAYARGGYYIRAFAYADSLQAISEFEEIMTLKLAFLELDTAQAKVYKIAENSTLLAVIQSYASDSTKQGYYLARAALKQVYNEDLRLTRLVLGESGARMATATGTDDTKASEELKNLNILKSNQPAGLKIYPNPTNGNFNLLYISEDAADTYYSIRDILGKELAKGFINPNITHEIEAQSFNDGIYFITLIQDNKLVEIQKIIVMK